MNSNSRPFDLYEAITDILTVFISSEIGGDVEFDNEAIAEYINSFACVADFWGHHSKEDIYEKFTEDILNGYPVWRMIKLPEWTLKMVEKSFNIECLEAEQRAKKTYRCLTCKHYCEVSTQLGALSKCKRERCSVNANPIGFSRGVLPQLRKVCRLYEKAV